MAFNIVGRRIRSDEQVSVETLVCFRWSCQVVGTEAELEVALIWLVRYDYNSIVRNDEPDNFVTHQNGWRSIRLQSLFRHSSYKYELLLLGRTDHRVRVHEAEKIKVKESINIEKKMKSKLWKPKHNCFRFLAF